MSRQPKSGTRSPLNLLVHVLGAFARSSARVVDADSSGLCSTRRVGALASSPAAAAQYAPLSAEGCFEQALEVDVRVHNVWARPSSSTPSPAPTEEVASFRVYYTPPPPPSRQSASDDDGRGVVFVCVHGAGYSGLSFAELARGLVQLAREEDGPGEGRARVGVLAYDARGHGASPSCPRRVFRGVDEPWTRGEQERLG